MVTSYTNVIGLIIIGQMLYRSIPVNAEIKAKYEACEMQLPVEHGDGLDLNEDMPVQEKLNAPQRLINWFNLTLIFLYHQVYFYFTPFIALLLFSR